MWKGVHGAGCGSMQCFITSEAVNPTVSSYFMLNQNNRQNIFLFLGEGVVLVSSFYQSEMKRIKKDTENDGSLLVLCFWVCLSL